MDKLKKAAAVAVMVGGMALGGGVAHADDGHDYYKDAADIVLGNVQIVECDQDFNGGALFTPAQVTGTGDNTQLIGNFCTVVGPVED
ncbi:hypothetical protein [Streptomyces azureus]|uniref:Secreted protein n=1 Tax=Streptomyces azureus TaxID=146537 RepID=A0A0K8PFE3_STRAJ|nr:hypothetical protein [Streptomyces azureus]GAP46611.1 uncharacterized protein SAZU_1349 [Streptomyces azureus]